MQTQRPVFLELWRIKLPVPGILSILHRVSGVWMVLALPFAAILFHRALSGPEGFAAVAATLDNWLVRLILLALAWGVLHHLFAGIRYLMLDLGLGVDRLPARRSAWTVMIAAVAVLVIGGGLAL